MTPHHTYLTHYDTVLQTVLIKDALHVHSQRVADVQRPLHEYLEEKYVEYVNMIEAEYNIKVWHLHFVF